MKVVKVIGIVLGTIILVPLIVALFVKKDYSVQRKLVINKPKQEVFAYIVLLKNQDNFSRWAKMDPNMKKTYTGTDGTVGFISAWDSKSDSVGTGEQEIKKITPNERVDFELRFKKPFEATNNAYLALADANNGTATEITWGFDGKMSYPMNLMLIGGNMDKMIGDDFQTGLNNLKQILEK